MKGVSFLATVAILALASSIASAYDPSPLQDFCVAINDIKSGGMYKTYSHYYQHKQYYQSSSFEFIISSYINEIMTEGFPPPPLPLHDIVAVHCYGNCLICDNNKLFFFFVQYL